MSDSAKVSYLGPEGSYTHQAAIEILGSDKEFIPSATITNAIHDLSSGLAQKAIVPVENSIAGGVAETIEALQKTEGLYIESEFVLPIKNCLLASKKDIDLSQVKKIRAHHMALGQCTDFIRTHVPSAEIIPSSSNSSAARDLKRRVDAGEDCLDHVVIASSLCADIYKLEIVKDTINDASINETRFWTLSSDLHEYNQASKNKSTVLFQTVDEPGSLQTVLRLFAVNHINLSRIESRPAKKNIGEYMFLVDFDLHKEDPRYEDLLRQMKQHFTYYKWLGSYSRLNK